MGARALLVSDDEELLEVSKQFDNGRRNRPTGGGSFHPFPSPPWVPGLGGSNEGKGFRPLKVERMGGDGGTYGEA